MASIMDLIIETEISKKGAAFKTNIILQVHRSHLDRVVGFLTECFGKDTSIHLSEKNEQVHEDSSEKTLTVEIIDAVRLTASKTLSIILLHSPNTKLFIDHLRHNCKFALKAINKIYVLSDGCEKMRFAAALESSSNRHARISDEGHISLVDNITSHLYEMMTKMQKEKNHKLMFKVETFPAKFQRNIVSKLFNTLEKNSIPEDLLDIGPSNYSHTLSVIQLGRPSTKKYDNGKLGQISSFLVGMAPVTESAPSFPPPYDSMGDDVCRAYFKLKEAFERYTLSPNDKSHTSTTKTISCGKKTFDWPFPRLAAGSKRKSTRQTQIIGVDCGSAPGGWTKYLMERTACTEIFSIDPGEMAESISSLSGVHHLKMTAAEAIPEIAEKLAPRQKCDDNYGVAIWVSDMCVHELTKQVDIFLLAKNAGIFCPGMAFVLTIKCNVGHAKERFDEITRKEVERLECVGAYGLKTFHLFSNRNGERTVMGFI